MDKACEAKFNLGDVKPKVQLMTNIFSDLKVTYVSGVPQKSSWLIAMINFMLNQKLVQDLQNDFERRVPLDMKSFVIEFFLHRFGNVAAGQQLLRDFIITLKKFVNDSQRFQLFAKMLGFHDMIGTSVTQRNSGFCRDAMQNLYFESSSGSRIYLKFCMIVDSFQDTRHGRPFVPFAYNRKSMLVPVEAAKSAFITMLAKEHLPTDIIEKYENDFTGLLQTDLFYRLQEDPIMNMKTEEQFVSIDLVADYILTHKTTDMINSLEMFYSSLKLNNNNSSWNESELAFDDMHHAAKNVFNNKSDAWINNCYKLMVDAPQRKGLSIGRMVENALPLFIKLERARTSYNKYMLNQSELEERNNLFFDANKKDEEYLKKHNYAKKDHMFKLKQQIIVSAEHKKKIGAKRREGNISEVVTGKPSTKKVVSPQGMIFASTNQITATYYDNISSMAALQETYNMLKESIITFEKNDETIATIHTDMKDLLNRFSMQIVCQGKFEMFLTFDQEVLRGEIEGCWKKFRKVLSKAMRS
jgi:hypothetical protein